MIRTNRVKQVLAAGGNVIGTFVKLTDPAAVEVLGLAGLDFFVLDNEHIAMNKESMVNILRAAELTDLVPVVRVRTNSPEEVLQALDAGALGVQVPQINTAAAARSLVRSAKYAPVGDRGYAPTTRAAGYGVLDPQEYARLANEATLTVAYCETAEAIDNLDEILAVEGLDCIFIGPFDLSQSLGVIGQNKHPLVLEAVDHIISETRRAGKAVGTIASSVEEARRLMDRGVQYITISSDLGILAGFVKAAIKELK